MSFHFTVIDTIARPADATWSKISLDYIGWYMSTYKNAFSYSKDEINLMPSSFSKHAGIVDIAVAN